MKLLRVILLICLILVPWIGYSWMPTTPGVTQLYVDTVASGKQDILTNYAGLVSAIGGQYLLRTDTNESVTGFHSQKAFRGTEATGAISNISTGDEGWTDGNYDPASLGGDYADGTTKYKFIKTTSSYSATLDANGNRIHGALQLPYSTSGDATLTEGYIQQKSDEDGIALHGGSTGEIQTEVFKYMGEKIIIGPFSPADWYDHESNYHVVPIDNIDAYYPHGFTLAYWKAEFVSATRTTALDMDLVCDSTPDWNPAAGATVMDVMDIANSSQSASASSGFDSATCANGYKMYLRFGADPTDANETLIINIRGYAEED